MANYIFLGPPGAGKGTMASMLSERCGQAHISTGDILRAEMKKGSDLGNRARKHVENGSLVPDELVAAIVSASLAGTDVKARGFILDGYPRNLKQAEILDADLNDNGLQVDAAVLFDVDEDLLLRRLTARRLCRNCGAVYNVLYNPPKQEGRCDQCGGELYQRADDTIETARERLQVYEKETAPVIDYYAGKELLIRVTGSQEKNDNFAILSEKLGLCGR